MNSLNRVYILGTLGTTPLLQSARNGKPFCKLRVATDNVYTSAGDDEEKRSTDWHYVHVFGRQAEVATQYLEKGRQVLVEGRLFSQPLGDGDKKTWRTWINADRVTFLGSRKKNESFKSDESESVLDGNDDLPVGLAEEFEVRGDIH